MFFMRWGARGCYSASEILLAYLHTPLKSYATNNNQNRDIKCDTHDICILFFILDGQFRGDFVRKNSC